MREERPMTAAEIVEKSKRFTLYDWSAQSKTAPIAVDRAEGVSFWDVDGKRYLDFNSQLMGVNIGHGDKRVADAIARQAEKPLHLAVHGVRDPRAAGREALDAVARAPSTRRSSRWAGRKPTRTRSASRRRTPDARRSSPGIARTTAPRTPPSTSPATRAGGPTRTRRCRGSSTLDPYRGTVRGTEDAEAALATLEETIELEGPADDRAFILEPVTGTNGS